MSDLDSQARMAQEVRAMEEVIVNAIEGQREVFVVMNALLRVHHYCASQLPPEVIDQIARDINNYACALSQMAVDRATPDTVH